MFTNNSSKFLLPAAFGGVAGVLYSVTLVTVAGILVVHTTYASAASNQSFDLDVNEIKSLSMPRSPVPAKVPPLPNRNSAPKKARKPVSRTSQRKVGTSQVVQPSPVSAPASPRTATTVPIQPAVKKNVPPHQLLSAENKIMILRKLPMPQTIPAPVPSNTVSIKSSLPTAELLTKLLPVLATPVADNEALHGIKVPASFAVRIATTTFVIASGLTESDVRHYAVKLSSHGIKLLNVAVNDAPETVVQKVAAGLGLPSQMIRSTPKNARVIYIFKSGTAKDAGVFVVLTNELPGAREDSSAITTQ